MDELGRLLAVQDQLVTRRQLTHAGMTRSALRWRVERGSWQEVLPGIFAGVTGTLTFRQRALAALLYGGPGSQLTGAIALTIHGLRYVPPDRYVRILIPHQRQRRSAGFARLHRTTRLDPAARRYHPLLVASAARAVADTARWCGEQRAVRAMVADVVQRGLTSVEQLRAELERTGRNGSGRLRSALAEVADGVRSVAEAQLRDVLKRSTRLPPIRWNPRLVTVPEGRPLPTPDGWLPEVGIALEVDSREFHTSPESWARTLERHNILSSYGALVLHFLPADIRRRPAQVLDRVEQSYQERLRSGARAAIRTAES